MSLLEQLTNFTGMQLHLAVVTVLLGATSGMLWLTPKITFMRKMGPYVWVIITAILLTNLGILPQKSPVYSEIFKYGVPLAIVLFLLEVDLKKVVKVITWRLMALWSITSLGSFLGGLLACLFFAEDPNMVKAIAGKAAAWIGGMPNFVAVSVSIFEIDPSYYASAAAVGVVPYLVWIAILFSLAGSKYEQWINEKWIKPTHSAADHAESLGLKEEAERPMNHRHILTLLFIAFAVFVLAKGIDQWTNGLSFHVPLGVGTDITIPWMLTLTTIAILVAWIFKTNRLPGSLHLSLTILYISLASYLAKSDIVSASQLAPTILPPFFLIIIIHVLAVIFGARLLKVDFATAAIVSVSNVGGSVTSPLIAVAYRLPAMIPMAVILASMGGIVANYLGWIIGSIFLE